MVQTDLSDYFKEMCKQAEWSLNQVQDAVRSCGGPPQTTKDQQSDTADDKATTDTTEDKGSGQWEELREHWRTHVDKLKKDTEKKVAELDADSAAHYAGEAETDAQHAIGHAMDSIEEAKRSVIYAVRSRAEANTLASDAARA